MTVPANHARIRILLVAVWLALIAGGLYLFVFHRELLQRELSNAKAFSAVAAATLYLLFGCLRGFTLIPSTALIIAGVPFFPPAQLFVLTLLGILISSASVYYFSEALHLDELMGERHKQRLERLKRALKRYELPVIVAWSFFPATPTDLVCYACGVLKIDLRKCLLGVGIGEGAICVVYIFLGDYALRFFELR